MKSFWTHLNAEPSVDEILDDPMVRLLMRGDGAGEGEVRRLIERVRAGLSPDVAPGAAPTGAGKAPKAA